MGCAYHVRFPSSGTDSCRCCGSERERRVAIEPARQGASVTVTDIDAATVAVTADGAARGFHSGSGPAGIRRTW